MLLSPCGWEPLWLIRGVQMALDPEVVKGRMGVGITDQMDQA